MTEPTPLDDLPVIDLAAGQRAFSEENLGRLMQLVGPHLNLAHRKLVYILPIASRFAHLAMESHALWNLYGGRLMAPSPWCMHPSSHVIARA